MEGLCKSTRDEPPTHFRFKIESFSTLSSSTLERYESCEFQTADYKWKLALYPKGNTKRGGKDHISLYLVAADKTSFNLNKEVLVTFTLFVFDHIRDKYLAFQEVTRFHSLKYESGFDKFLPLKTFNDPSKGYLLDDTCMFGAEVFIIGNTLKGQCLSLPKKKSPPFKFSWKIQKFSGLKNKPHYSEKFTVGGHDWKILLYPKGYDTGKENSISLYLHLADSGTALQDGEEILLEFTLRVVDQVNIKHKENGTNTSLNALVNSWGWPEFLSFIELNSSTGFVVDDVMILEAEVCVCGSAKNWN
ncbi:hypothetical protein ACHQM5_005857 [Ranunculus cassubicifolius]